MRSSRRALADARPIGGERPTRRRSSNCARCAERRLDRLGRSARRSRRERALARAAAICIYGHVRGPSLSLAARKDTCHARDRSSSRHDVSPAGPFRPFAQEVPLYAMVEPEPEPDARCPMPSPMPMPMPNPMPISISNYSIVRSSRRYGNRSLPTDFSSTFATPNPISTMKIHWSAKNGKPG
jgi:hypothetical protein